MKINPLKKIVPALTGKESRLRENLSVMYTGDRLEPAIKAYRKRLLKNYAAVLSVTLLLALAAVLSSYLSDVSIHSVERPGAGSADRTVPVKVEAEYKGQKVESVENLNISAVVMTEKQKKKILSDFSAGLPDRLVKEDEKGRRMVTDDLDLMERDEETGIDIVWTSSDPELISNEGRVDITELGSRAETVTLTAAMTLGGVTKETSFDVCAAASPELYGVSARNQIKAAVEKVSESGSGKSVLLPDKSPGGISLRWSEQTSSYAVLIVAIGLLLFFSVHAGRYDRAEKSAKKYREDVAADFPFIVDKLVLLLNSGLTVFSALMRISSDYADESRYGYSPAAAEVAAIGRRVKDTNSSVTEEWKAFATRMESSDILRFCTILEDNLSKGSELAEKLENESEELRELRKKSIQKYIRLIDSKMTIPMLIMLFSLVLVTISPIITGF